MNKIIKLSAAAILVFSTAQASFAADITELKVQGTLIMGACTPTLTSGGVVDYGRISLDSLSATAVNQLGTKEITLSLTCKSPIKAAFSIIDDQSASVIDTQPVVYDVTAPSVTDEFGLGKTEGGVDLGSYAIMATNNTKPPIVDTVPGQIAYSDDNAATWTPSSTAGSYAHGDGSRMITFVDTQGAPVAFTTASDVLAIGSSVQGTNALAITDDTPLTGQATISVVYL